MTITAVVTIPTDDGKEYNESFSAWGPHKEAVRFKSNPSALSAVTRVKALSALLIAEIEGLKARAHADEPDELGSQEIFTRARQQVVDASMWTVLGATKGM